MNFQKWKLFSGSLGMVIIIKPKLTGFFLSQITSKEAANLNFDTDGANFDQSSYVLFCPSSLIQFSYLFFRYLLEVFSMMCFVQIHNDIIDSTKKALGCGKVQIKRCVLKISSSLNLWLVLDNETLSEIWPE